MSGHGGGPRRKLRRAAASLAVTAAAVAIPLGRSGAAEKPPSIFDITVAAAPVQTDLAAVTVLPLPLDNGVARSSVSMNSQPFVISQAAVAWAPLGETVLAAQPDAASAAWCYSYFPTGPGNPAEARCGGGNTLPVGLPVEAGSGHTVTSGDADDPTTLVSRSSTKATGIGGESAGLPAPLGIGSAASTAESKGEGDKMTGAGATAIDDIDVAGVLSIRSVRSFVSGALTGESGGAAVDHDLTVSGAAVAGQPVEIDENGVHAVGQATLPLAGVDQQEQLNQILASAGLRVSIVPAPAPQVADDGTTLSATSGSLRIEFENFETGIFTRVDIGQVEVGMQASRVEDFTIPEDPPAEDPEKPTGGTPSLAVPDGSSTDTSGSVTTSTPKVAAPRPPSPGEGAGDPSREVTQVAVEPIDSEEWDLPYQPFALIILALPIALRVRRFTIARR